MDWIKVKSSGKDLTGLRGRLIEVTEEELAKHNKKTDCWICIRGIFTYCNYILVTNPVTTHLLGIADLVKLLRNGTGRLVYNVTPYMEYHPGGEEELMKAAGADGTQLFDQVHRWVNYESMLKECLIGRIAVKHASLLKGGTPAKNTGKELVNGALSNSKIPQEPDEPFHPSFDWFQTDSTVTIVIYTKQKNMSSDLVTVDYQENVLRGEIIVGDYSYLLLIALSHRVQNFEVHASGTTGKIEVILQKKDHNVWKSLGQPLTGNDSFTKNSQRGTYYRKCRLSSITKVNHNTRLFCFELPPGCHLQVPVGHHVYLKLNISGIEVVKPYTPVSQTLVSDHLQPSQYNEQYIYMMIKIYPNGSFTPQIDKLAIGDYVSVSNPQGCFRTTQVEAVEDIFLLAAGTGFTPMAKLLRHLLNSSSSLRKVKLIFFNKTEDDILWREQLENMCLTDKRFEAEFILSEPSDSWVGYKGQISAFLLSEVITRNKKNSNVLTCICGPNGFIDQGIRFLGDLGFSQEDIFVFKE